ncbi:AAA family ATPase [Desulfurobacterium thermolithotrophum]|uniref:ATP-binding protein n=1 Tax=Desulfurobacterium thermolithotrophum TaxID=64160 RepID=UPI0013CF4D9B|nr:ATP-binding protein [Desulfurobacterium thermolithotrophum]
MRISAESIANTTVLKKLAALVHELNRLSEEGIEAVAVCYGSYGIGKTWGIKALEKKLGLDNIGIVKGHPKMDTPNKFLRAAASAVKCPTGRSFDDTLRYLTRFAKHRKYVIIVDEAEFVLAHKDTAATIKLILEETLFPFVLVGNENLPKLVARVGSLDERVIKEVHLDSLTKTDVKELLKVLEIEADPEAAYKLAQKYGLSILKFVNALKLIKRSTNKPDKALLKQMFERIVARV